MKKEAVALIAIVVTMLIGGIYLYRSQYQTPQKTIPYHSLSITPEKDADVTEGLDLEITEPTSGMIKVASPSFQIKGTTAASADVFVADRELKADAQGNFVTTITLDEGENIIIILANDDEGNFAERTLIITLESVE